MIRCEAVFMRSVLAYTAARLLLFAVTFGVLYLLGARGLLAAALAVLISGLVSFVLLTRQRDAMSDRIAGGVSRVKGVGARLEEGAAKEDDAAQRTAGRTEHDSDRAETADAVGGDSVAEPSDGGAQPEVAAAESPRSADEPHAPEESGAD